LPRRMTFDPLCSIRRTPVETALTTTLLVFCAAPLGVRCVATFTCGDLLLERRGLLFLGDFVILED